MKNFLFILWLIPIKEYAQSPSWQTVTIVPPIEVRNMVTDSLGFLWMNDEHALYRYDGLEAIEMISLGDEEISSISYSKSDEIAIGTSYGRLLLFNPYLLSHTVIYENDAYNAITNSLVMDKENFVALSYGHGIYLNNHENRNKYNVENGLISNEVYEAVLFQDKLYIATDQGIQVLNPLSNAQFESTLTLDNGLSDMVITHLAVHNGELWYSDYDRHIGRLSITHNASNYPLPNKSKINSLVSHGNSLYVATDQGLYHFANHKFSLKLDGGVKLAQLDEEGNLWNISAQGALRKGNLYFQKMELPFKETRTIEFFGNSVILGNELGIYKLVNDKFTKTADENVTFLKSYHDYLLVGTFSDGFKVYDSQFDKVYALNEWNNISNESVLNIYPYENEVFISSLSGVMSFQMHNEQLIPKTSLNPIIGQAYIYTMLIHEDQMYFGSDRNGISVWHKSKDKISILNKFEDGDNIGSVYAIAKDYSGRIWFTSSEYGLGYISNGRAKKLSHVPNVKDEYTSLISLQNKNLLLIRGNSIDILDPASMHIMYFDKELGLEKNIPYLNSLITVQNKAFFVHNNNLYVYESPAEVKIHPEVIIDQANVNLIPVQNGENIFSQDENNFQFDFRGSWLSDPQKLTYQYQLEGFDRDWRNTKDHSVSYPKLPPNDYLFRVRASENGVFNDEPEAKYPFKIRRHFYNLWWVRSLFLLFIGGVVYKILKKREERRKEQLVLEKLNVENQIINLRNQLNPHFLFNSFNTLIGLIEEDSDRSVVFVEKMSDFYRNIIEFGKSNLISLADEREVLTQFTDILKARFNDQLSIEAEWGEDIDRYKIPPLTLQLLVENAVKHNVVSTKNPLKITIHHKADSIIIFNKKKALLNKRPSTYTGLKNIKLRFKLVNLDEPRIHETDDYFQVTLKVKIDESNNT